MQTLALESELNIFNAAEQKPRLLEFLECDEELEVDLANVSEIDTAGLQLLILIKREAMKAGKKLKFVMHSQAVLNVLELTNLTGTFGDQVVLSSDEE
ncbi:lipid asymmetry maintenance protein MlaB [Methylotuvimicrobium buryatense]|uniref:Anti-sigma factor antagonist n=1 Tax=Methylotuvimicrobium buryatense TaxID=95641 RepID=A0A4P9USJ5_METBY|nr:STAS domain-containing protein [Methylotuvimicrobium buryatense]QCW84512.1 anti-sigma factor antagonist [Methylotuvimicrobium buryatense]